MMGSRNKSIKKRGCVSPEIMEAAKAISELKGENLDDIEAQFFTDYVRENLHVLTEKAKVFESEKSDSHNA